MVDTFVPVLTAADLDAARSSLNLGKDPREPWTERDLPAVLVFLAYAAELKAMSLPQRNPGHWGYETMLYEYAVVAASII